MMTVPNIQARVCEREGGGGEAYKYFSEYLVKTCGGTKSLILCIKNYSKQHSILLINYCLELFICNSVCIYQSREDYKLYYD